MDFTQYLDKEIFRVVAKAAEASGVDVYVVGGYVRDLVLGRPSKDIDFVCVGSGIALAKKWLHYWVRESRPTTSAISAQPRFGMATLTSSSWAQGRSPTAAIRVSRSLKMVPWRTI